MAYSSSAKWKAIAVKRGVDLDEVEEARRANLHLAQASVLLARLLREAEAYREEVASSRDGDRSDTAVRDVGRDSEAVEDHCGNGEELPSGKEWKLLCRVCDKPNSLHVRECSSCGFPMEVPADAEVVVTNPFIPIIQGTALDHEVIRREDECLVFRDKFPVAEVHLQCIPTMLGIEDASFLAPPLLATAEAISLCKRMREVALDTIKEEVSSLLDVSRLRQPFERYVVLGFNLPVSVRHLHLHAAFPPLHNVEGTFRYPRFHPFDKVIADLERDG
eukprot:CAMPEP_0114611200 /NCGR_PEP_ID=MMETSP0168-20121206/3990_1 /TAXON_ID=95228 ORGANISM="Vannella sp., Strain DIVA3 517/6/12" /NCGR_SAMPLE_ID=MMETSP0168 /ASSEMBLY_ACC=CAM_ASM_000044 /LENGTH=275 /DNA_ID=CAMNT_0001822159 /DNA_START=37 /DNA_END=861 /DNA_ORIENTATION=-